MRVVALDPEPIDFGTVVGKMKAGVVNVHTTELIQVSTCQINLDAMRLPPFEVEHADLESGILEPQSPNRRNVPHDHVVAKLQTHTQLAIFALALNTSGDARRPQLKYGSHLTRERLLRNGISGVEFDAESVTDLVVYGIRRLQGPQLTCQCRQRVGVPLLLEIEEADRSSMRRPASETRRTYIGPLRRGLRQFSRLYCRKPVDLGEQCPVALSPRGHLDAVGEELCRKSPNTLAAG